MDELTERQHEEEMIKRFPDYPCYVCLRKNTCTVMCVRFETFARKHWNSIHETGKMLSRKKIINHKQKRIRLVADVRDIMQSELDEWIKRNELDSNEFPAICEILNGHLVKCVVDRLLHGK